MAFVVMGVGGCEGEAVHSIACMRGWARCRNFFSNSWLPSFKISVSVVMYSFSLTTYAFKKEAYTTYGIFPYIKQLNWSVEGESKGVARVELNTTCEGVVV